MKIENYEEAVKYLERFIGKIVFKIDPASVKLHPPLDRMKMLLKLLNNPQEKFKSVLVGGTSGKGSTAYLISHILTTAGYKTGFTLSPHLQKVNERLQINNQPISDEKFVKLLKSSILPSIRQMSKIKVGGPSYFEILIAMAFLYFVKQRVDIAIVEVGMGGEFDATNTLNPLVAVLTNVGLDHANVLGKTVEKIARTKAGIIKKSKIPPKARLAKGGKNQKSNLIVVTGVKQPSVIKIVENRCGDVGAKLFRLGKDFNYKIKKESLGRSIFDLTVARGRGLRLNNLKLTLLGNYQIENASLAIETVLNLQKFGFKVTDDAIRKALSTAFFPGRFEIIRGPVAPSSHPMSSVASSLRVLDGTPSSRATPLLILDGAHNPTKMEEFLKSLKKLFPKEKKIFVIGFKFDKDIGKMLKQITKVADKIIITEFNRSTDMAVSASADALKINNQILKIKYGGETIIEKDSKKALGKALASQQFSNSTIIVVTGSLYLVGEVRGVL